MELDDWNHVEVCDGAAVDGEQAWAGLSVSAAEAAAPAGYPPLPEWHPPPADPPPLLGAGRGAALVTPHFVGASGLLMGEP